MSFNYGTKIRALLDTAADLQAKADAATDPERRNELTASAANYRAKAEQLMRDYRIAEEEALASDPYATTPQWTTITLLGESHTGTMSAYTYKVLFSAIAHHTGVRFAAEQKYLGGGRYTIVAHVCGYEGDIRYAEFLWTAAYMMFTTRIDPVWDDSRTDAENIFLLRNAGIERRVIADRAWGNGDVASARSRVQRIYAKECERRGEPVRAAGLSHDTKTYRDAYADSFINTLRYRLQAAHDAADSAGGVLVLAGRSDRVDEAFYDRYPAYRPSTEPVKPAEPCSKCKPGQPCRAHRWTAADEKRWQRRYNSASALAGMASGAQAAEGVALRSTDRAARLDASGRAIES